MQPICRHCPKPWKRHNHTVVQPAAQTDNQPTAVVLSSSCLNNFANLPKLPFTLEAISGATLDDFIRLLKNGSYPRRSNFLLVGGLNSIERQSIDELKKCIRDLNDIVISRYDGSLQVSTLFIPPKLVCFKNPTARHKSNLTKIQQFNSFIKTFNQDQGFHNTINLQDFGVRFRQRKNKVTCSHQLSQWRERHLGTKHCLHLIDPVRRTIVNMIIRMFKEQKYFLRWFVYANMSTLSLQLLFSTQNNFLTTSDKHAYYPHFTSLLLGVLPMLGQRHWVPQAWVLPAAAEVAVLRHSFD